MRAPRVHARPRAFQRAGGAPLCSLLGSQAQPRCLSVRARRGRRPEGLHPPLDPRGPFMRRWDIIIALLLTFTATVTPFEARHPDGTLGMPHQLRQA